MQRATFTRHRKEIVTQIWELCGFQVSGSVSVMLSCVLYAWLHFPRQILLPEHSFANTLLPAVRGCRRCYTSRGQLFLSYAFLWYMWNQNRWRTLRNWLNEEECKRCVHWKEILTLNVAIISWVFLVRSTRKKKVSRDENSRPSTTLWSRFMFQGGVIWFTFLSML